MTGFRIDRLVVTGENLSPASIEFFDGCNLVLGPSNTGKTFIVDAIDYMLGGSEKPEEIDEARGYDSVYLQITTREPKPRTIVLNRGLFGGGLRIAEVRYDEITQSTVWNRVGVKHSKRSTDTVVVRETHLFSARIERLTLTPCRSSLGDRVGWQGRKRH